MKKSIHDATYISWFCKFIPILAIAFYSTSALSQIPGTVIAWGDNSQGESTVPSQATNIVAIAIGNQSCLALSANGTVVAWGANNAGQINVPAGLSNVVAIAEGDQHSLALTRSGTVIGWGNNSEGQIAIPSQLTNVIAISAGGNQSLALTASGTVAVWGDNSFGQGNIPAGLANVIGISAGYFFNLALTSNETVVAWGDSGSGELNIPSGLSSVVALSTGPSWSLAATSAGQVVAWGSNPRGQLNIPSGLSNAVAIAAGFYHGLAVTSNGLVVAWGDNDSGQCSVPSGLSNVVAVAAGSASSLALIGNFSSSISIISQPQSQSTILGTSPSLSVGVTGKQPISYQWQLYGTNISGANNSTLTFTNVQLTDAGDYSLVVSNSFGITNSATAILQVLPQGAPSIKINGQLAVGTLTYTSSVQVTISGGFTNGYILYTLDGSTPTFTSPLYNGAFAITNFFTTIEAMSLSSDLSQSAYAPPIDVIILPIYSLQTGVVGNGTISVNPSSGSYVSNSLVTLTATPSADWAFDHWTGDASGNHNPLNLTMNRPLNVQAVFVAIPFYNLTTSVVGNGTLSINPPNGPYLSNTMVTVTANGSASWPFDHWTGDATGNQNPLTLTMDSALNVQAVFVQNYPVTVSTAGGGSVTVNGQTIAPQTYYPVGSVQTITATANNGWTFLGWQGNATGTNNPLSLTVNGTNNIQALFGTVVATNALGGGSIALNQPNPIPYGTVLTASAIPNSGFYFVTWGGAASGTNAPTTISVTTPNPTISALFSALPTGKYSLSVLVSGNGSVGISAQNNYYNAGDNVTLTALPVVGLTSFYGWSLGASGTNTPLTLVMNTNQIVEASFGSLPVVSITPTNLVVEEDSNAVLTANAAGIPPLVYQWQDSEGIIVGATNATFLILSAQAANADNYSVVVSNPFGAVTSLVATVTVVYQPSITFEPVPQTVAAGTPVNLSVTATGTLPLSYQWLNSLGAIQGATNNIYSLNPAQTNNWDNYLVVVRNAYGAVTSTTTPLIVYGPVTVTSEPLSQVVSLGSTASFTVLATAYPAPVYQWTFSGTNIPAATSNRLTITNVDLPNVGYYQVLINNGYSTNDNNYASLNISPSFVSPFQGATAVWGKGATLSVGAVGSGQLNYQWYFNGEPISGATGATLTFTSIQFTNAGLYSVVVSSEYGTITNTPYEVVVNPAAVALGFYPGLMISGVSGYSYIIQSSTNLANTNGWMTLTNLSLTEPTQLFIDTNVDASSPFNSKTFYKILPGQ